MNENCVRMALVIQNIFSWTTRAKKWLTDKQLLSKSISDQWMKFFCLNMITKMNSLLYLSKFLNYFFTDSQYKKQTTVVIHNVPRTVWAFFINNLSENFLIELTIIVPLNFTDSSPMSIIETGRRKGHWDMWRVHVVKKRQNGWHWKETLVDIERGMKTYLVILEKLKGHGNI